MRRRAFLATTTAALAGLAGCQGDDPTAGNLGEGQRSDTPPPTGESTSTPTGDGGTPTATQTAAVEGEYPVAASELLTGQSKDGIPAIVDPAFGEDWSGISMTVRSAYGGTRTITPRLEPDDRVIGVEREGTARAYPLRILNWHEVVNDTFGGPLLVTYCPLCNSGVTAVREVNGRTTTFGVSGKLWRANLVMYDERTGSLWSQVVATAIRGPMAGEQLTLLPSAVTSWEEWRAAHPDTRVLLPPPESGTVVRDDATRNYTVNPYGRYDSSTNVGLRRTDYDDRIPPKTLVVGVSDGDAARGYPLPEVTEAGLINDRVGSLPVVVTTDASGELVAYDRRVDGTTLTFEATGADHAMGAGGSFWRRSTGEALDGPYEGSNLDRANDRSPMYWFSWADVAPETDVYGRSTDG